MKGDKYSGYVLTNNGFMFSKSEKELIKQNVIRILNTRKGERLNNPEFGSNVKEYLFLPNVYVTDLLNEIKVSIERNEPRVKVQECTLESAGQDDIVSILLKLLIIGEDETEEVEVKI